MDNGLFQNIYNPDVLSCIANLSNDEVFTPPELANKMLDMLPQELFENPDTTFLDPACKSGVFLREIAKRLIKGLEPQMPNLEKRLEHIYTKQLFGIAITELTSLLSRRSVYCSKFPSSRFSVFQFEEEQAQGNIFYNRIQHSWVDNRCKYCGASKGEYDRGDDLESYAYQFIHINHPFELFNMKFDVIIGNPPYQLSDGGAQASAIPIYQRFIEQAKKLNPRYLSMIIPARWYGGGRGLDDFREEMISDKHITELHDFLNASDCFGNGVEIKGGVCFFLRDRDNERKCKVFTHNGNKVIEQEPRYLKEDGSDVFIRNAEGVSIYHKVKALNEETIETLVSSQKPFGLRTFAHGKEKPFPGSVELYERGGIGYISPAEIEKNIEWVNKPKVFLSRAYNAGDVYPHQIIGKPILGKPGTCCTETYMVLGPLSSVKEAENFISYIKTKFFRCLVMLKKTSQMLSQGVYSFVPIQDFTKPWTDEELYAKYGFSDEEISFIDAMIRPME